MNAGLRGELAHRQLELGLGGVDASVRRVHVGAARPAEPQQRHVVVRSDEVVENRAPLLRTLAVAGSLAREHQRAADVRERLEGGRLATRHRRHGLVEPARPRSGLAHRHLGEAELRERSEFEIGVAVASATSRAADANDAAVAASRAASERVRSSQPRSAPGATSRRRRSARASQPREAASLSNASPYSLESHSATRAARASSPSRRNPHTHALGVRPRLARPEATRERGRGRRAPRASP